MKSFDAVVVFKLDRLGRNAKEILEVHDLLNEYKIVIISLTENIDTSTPHGKMYFTIIAAFSEMELGTIVLRTTLGKETKVRKGKYLNGPKTSYGYVYNLDEKFLRPIPQEAEVVRQMFKWIKDGASIREVTRRLINLGINNSKGHSNWDKSTVGKMLRHPVYAGYVRYRSKRNGEIITKAENIETIITKQEFDDVQVLLDARSGDNRKKHARTSFYFADVLYCAECGAKMVTTVSYNKKGTELRKNYQYYRCANKYKVVGNINRCDESVSTSQLKLMRLFWKYIESFVFPKGNPEIIKEVRDYDAEILDVEKEILKISNRKSSLLKKFLDDLVPQDIYKKTLDEFIKESNFLEKTKQSLIEQKNNASNNTSIILESVINSIDDFRSSFERLNDNQKRFFITKTIKKIYVSAKEITSIEFN